MNAVLESISDLTYAFDLLDEQLTGLTEAELTTVIVDQVHGFTVRDMLAHLSGWADYTLEVLPVMLKVIDNELPPIDVESRNEAALAANRGKSVRQVQRELADKHGKILAMVENATPEELTMRRSQRGKIFTIKSYVIDVLQHHILEHTESLREWRENRARQQAWIRWVPDEEATGLLKKEYDAGKKRAGRVWNIVRVMSLRPAALRSSMQLYGSIVQQESSLLTRAHREMIAVVVSQLNDCHY